MILNTWIDPGSLELGRFAHQAGGFTAISRWLSGATPPEAVRIGFRIPEGCQHEWYAGTRISDRSIPQGLRSLRDRSVRGRRFRGCRSAQPPANGWHPFGMAVPRVAGDLMKMEVV